MPQSAAEPWFQAPSSLNSCKNFVQSETGQTPYTRTEYAYIRAATLTAFLIDYIVNNKDPIPGCVKRLKEQAGNGSIQSDEIAGAFPQISRLRFIAPSRLGIDFALLLLDYDRERKTE